MSVLSDRVSGLDKAIKKLMDDVGEKKITPAGAMGRLDQARRILGIPPTLPEDFPEETKGESG